MYVVCSSRYYLRMWSEDLLSWECRCLPHVIKQILLERFPISLLEGCCGPPRPIVVLIIREDLIIVDKSEQKDTQNSILTVMQGIVVRGQEK